MIRQRDILIRFVAFQGLTLAVGIAVAVLLFHIVAKYKVESKELDGISTRPILANKGNILAHDGRLLVTSVLKYRLSVDFRADGLTDKDFNYYVDTIANGLARILKEKTVQEYAKEWRIARANASKNRNYPLTRKAVDYITYQQLQALPILKRNRNKGGLIVEKQIDRVYPYKDMAHYTLGWVNKNHQGVGIEYSYLKQMNGQSGMEICQLVGKNTLIPINSEPEVLPVDGCDIVSTLDIDLQEIAEEEIERQLLNDPDLEWGTAVVMDVQTGEIRAIVNKHKKSPSSHEIVEDENYALRFRKDPGSTFKLVSFLIMLEKGLNLNDSVDTQGGSVTLHGKKYEDEGSGKGTISAAQVFEYSSNVGTIELSRRMYPNKANWNDFSDRIETLKIKDITDFDINPQQNIAPVIRMQENDGMALYAMSIGTSLEMTPLQTLTIYNAVANDGCMVHPRFVKEIRKGSKVIEKSKTKIVNKTICSKKTLEKLQGMLLGVVEHGTAKQARSNIFPIAGKTGTAHLSFGNKGYSNQKLASFAGYFPADNPKYSCIVAFKTFEVTHKTFGGSKAAPVFKNIAEKIYAHSVEWQTPAGDYDNSLMAAPYTKSGKEQALRQTLARLQIPITGCENREWVSTSSVDNAVELQPRSIVSRLVPNVKNMGLKDAVFLLESNGMRVHFLGKGTVMQQIPAAGSPYEMGDAVRLVMSVE
ncbi:penicillin-binding protein [Bacteroidia bacterium]|nr:penicillin-binding protein [Bacteroidia bacterium]